MWRHEKCCEEEGRGMEDEDEDEGPRTKERKMSNAANFQDPSPWAWQARSQPPEIPRIYWLVRQDLVRIDRSDFSCFEGHGVEVNLFA